MAPAFEMLETVGETPTTVLRRARNTATGQTVLIKTHLATCPSARDRTRLRHEHEVLAELKVPGTLRLVGVEALGDHAALVFEDFPGTTLATLLRRSRLEPP